MRLGCTNPPHHPGPWLRPCAEGAGALTAAHFLAAHLVRVILATLLSSEKERTHEIHAEAWIGKSYKRKDPAKRERKCEQKHMFWLHTSSEPS